eukprot:scaffold18242_cov36-Phaeocystis_antarctica.AAC.2
MSAPPSRRRRAARGTRRGTSFCAMREGGRSEERGRSSGVPRAVLLLGERKQGVTRTIWARNQVFDGECSGLGYGGVRQGPVTEHFAVPTCYKHSKACTGSVTDPSEVPNARSQSSEIGAHAARDGHGLR